MKIAGTIYARSPVWMQDLMISIQGFIYNRQRFDMELAKMYLAELLESQWWTSEQFQEAQNIRLRDHINYAAKNIPYYQELFKKESIDPESIKSIDDLRKLPILEKETVRKRPTDFLPQGAVQKSWNKLFTSGTTGSPMTVYYSRTSFTRLWSFVFRLRHWAGLDDPFFPRRVQFTGRDIVPDKKITSNGVYWRRNIPGNSLLMSTSHLSQDSVRRYIDKITEFKPDLVDGYPSAILIVAKMACQMGLKLHGPKAVITTAETLSIDHRREIEATFGCKVFNQYASTESGTFITSCEHGHLHVNPEFGICEILNKEGRPAYPGEDGEIITTSFCNREQVLIRYRIGDTAIQGSNEVCRCGRAMPRIDEIEGRIDDLIYIPGRGFVGRFDPVFKGLTGIYEAQIVHESLNRLLVKFVPGKGYNQETQAALIANLRKKVGTEVSIELECVKEIPRGPNGKFRAVVSKCSDQYPRLREMNEIKCVGSLR